MWNKISQAISQATGQDFTLQKRYGVGGGCINQGYQLLGSEGSYFIKLNQANRLAMFEAEALGLEQMLLTQTIRVPRPICLGVVEGYSYLVLEWLDFAGRGKTESWEAMGQKLATLHLAGGAQQFGWQRDNTIGSTPQPNPWYSSWSDFFAEQRLGYQLQLARRRGGDFPQPDLVIAKVKTLLQDRQPQPSLVHGDLWSGNAAILESGEPVLLDPATYYGDHEVDVAMTELFGGFPAAFYAGYHQVLPLDPGYQKRKNLYNLYHILNHFNLFGGSYEAQANQMLRSIFV